MTFPLPALVHRFVPGAVNLDGTNDWLTRAAGITGGADGKLFTFSAFLNPAADQTQRLLTANLTLGGAAGADVMLGIALGLTGTVVLVGRNAAGTIILNLVTSTTPILAANGWHHLYIAIDLANASNRHIFVNGVTQALTVTTYTNDAIDMTVADWTIGATSNGTNKFSGDMAEVWFKDVFLDPATNLSSFARNNKPQNLYVNGARPGAAAPLIYLGGHSRYNGLTSAWHTNRGSGGGFTVTGALTDASTNPS
jgi:hypothetical protein